MAGMARAKIVMGLEKEEPSSSHIYFWKTVSFLK
jgi:hypothetical protein